MTVGRYVDFVLLRDRLHKRFDLIANTVRCGPRHPTVHPGTANPASTDVPEHIVRRREQKYYLLTNMLPLG